MRVLGCLRTSTAVQTMTSIEDIVALEFERDQWKENANGAVALGRHYKRKALDIAPATIIAVC
jgi:hypothetical protein